MTTITISSSYYTVASLSKFSDKVFQGFVKCSGKNSRKEHRAYYYPATGEFVVQEGDKRIVVDQSFFSIQ